MNRGILRHFLACVDTSAVIGSRKSVSSLSTAASGHVSVADQLPSWQKPIIPSREVWIESLKQKPLAQKEILPLDPRVFAEYPRIDILFHNIRWQNLYRRVDYANTPARHEVGRTGKKPYPQKRTGRARHGDKRSNIFLGGAVAHGPKSPKAYYCELPFMTRLKGLTTALSAKLAQDDLHIVDSLELDTEDRQEFEDMLDSKRWGPSVLFVDNTDLMPERISTVADQIPHYNLMPVYGLNVYSMLKHTTLVLTVDAVREIQEKIIYHMNRTDRPAV